MDNENVKLRILKDYFGHDSFRDGQEELIDAVLAGRDVLGIMPTGAGKSMCYQIPALIRDGITVVVSPLISLMKDQVNALIQSGVKAAYLNSSLTQQQYETALRYAARGAYKLIYVAPERLCTPSFLSFAENAPIALAAVDEAHCVSQWGQDFRPSYMRIPEFLSRLPYRPPVAAFTATATPEVKEDICRMLGLEDPFCVTTGFDRRNLMFSVVTPKDKFAETLAVIKRNKGRSGIIYCATRKKVEEVCGKLRDLGYACGRYHAGLTDEERRSSQDDFIYDRIEIMTATNAFGMGIDKSNVGFVLHYNMPKNIESYYQEAGRAGRDGQNAECVLLYSPQDVRINTFLIEQNENPDLDDETAEMLKKRDLDRLRRMTAYCTTTSCLREFILGYFGEQSDNYCGSCSNCLAGFEEQDVTVEAQKILSCIYRLRQRRTSVGAGTLTDILRGSKAEKILSRHYDTLSTYNIMADIPASRVRQMINHLIALGYVKVSGEFSVLELTAKAKAVLTDGEKVYMKLPKEKKRSRSKDVSDGIYALDSGLFGRLKALRSRLASAARLPAYTIFTDTALRDICVKRPTTEEELLDCSGIGRSKQQRYGKQIIAEVKAYLEETGGSPEDSSLIGRRERSQQAGGSDMLMKLVRFNRSKLTPDDKALTIPSLCDRILECLGIAADRDLLRKAIEDWYLDNGYLAKKSEAKSLSLTILSEEAGLTEERRFTSKGFPYVALAVTPEGQKYLFENAEEVFR